MNSLADYLQMANKLTQFTPRSTSRNSSIKNKSGDYYQVLSSMVDNYKQRPTDESLALINNINDTPDNNNIISNMPMSVQSLAQSVVNARNNLTNNYKFLQSKEGANNSYTTPNMAGSSAYGKYQFMPSTAKMYAKQLGIDPNQWQLPANQEAIMDAADKDYSRVLVNNNLKVSDANKYALHQEGPAGGIRILKNSPTASDIENMNNNLPQNLRSTNAATVMANWKNKYLQ